MGRLSKETRIKSALTKDSASAECIERPDCYAISSINGSFFLHNETIVLSPHQFFASGTANEIRSKYEVCKILNYSIFLEKRLFVFGNIIKLQDPYDVWLLRCGSRREYLHQFEDELILPSQNYSIATLDFTIFAKTKPTSDVFFYTTIKPVVEYEISDFTITQSKKKLFFKILTVMTVLKP